MKKLISIVVLTMAFWSANAQDCNAIVLPLFQYDSVRLSQYPADKVMYRCLYSQASFYESDTIPAGVDVYDISQVKETYGTNYLPQSYVVDLTTLSYYAYNFQQFQFLYPTGSTTICFYTPSSTHPYLVLRSIEESHRLAEEGLNDYYRELGN